MAMSPTFLYHDSRLFLSHSAEVLIIDGVYALLSSQFSDRHGRYPSWKTLKQRVYTILPSRFTECRGGNRAGHYGTKSAHSQSLEYKSDQHNTRGFMLVTDVGKQEWTVIHRTHTGRTCQHCPLWRGLPTVAGITVCQSDKPD